MAYTQQHSNVGMLIKGNASYKPSLQNHCSYTQFHRNIDQFESQPIQIQTGSKLKLKPNLHVHTSDIQWFQVVQQTFTNQQISGKKIIRVMVVPSLNSVSADWFSSAACSASLVSASPPLAGASAAVSSAPQTERGKNTSVWGRGGSCRGDRGVGKLLLDDRWLNRKEDMGLGWVYKGRGRIVGEGRKLWLGIIEERWD